MELCQNHFQGTLYTPPPQQKSSFFLEQEISQEREFVASHIGNYKKMFLIMQTYFGGQSYYFPPFSFSPPNPVSSWAYQEQRKKKKTQSVYILIMKNYDLKGLHMCVKCVPTHRILYIRIWDTFRNSAT
jgi:hypothetical protein